MVSKKHSLNKAAYILPMDKDISSPLLCCEFVTVSPFKVYSLLEYCVVYRIRNNDRYNYWDMKHAKDTRRILPLDKALSMPLFYCEFAIVSPLKVYSLLEYCFVLWLRNINITTLPLSKLRMHDEFSHWAKLYQSHYFAVSL